MTRFRVEIPADPRWAHVATTVGMTAAASQLDLSADRLDDVALALGEGTVAVAATPGVTRLAVSGRIEDERFVVDLVGNGQGIRNDDALDLLGIALDALADEHVVVTDDHEYRITLHFAARPHRG